jgi:hypothetical protein
MSDFIWPATLIPARTRPMLRDLSSRFASPFTGTTYAYSRPGGDVIGLQLDMPPMTATQAAAFRGAIARMRGAVNRVWCGDHAYVKRGSFPSTELLSNNTFASGTTGCTSAYSTATVADRVLRLLVASHTAGQYPAATAAATLVSGSAYAARALFQNPSNTAIQFGINFDAGTAAAATSYATTAGLRICSAVADGTGGNLACLYYDTSSTADAVDISYTSVSRCALVMGASQTGNRLLIDALPISTDGLLLEGDQVQIGEELLHVIAPLNSNSSGQGYLALHRPLRTAPADNAPVIIHEPMGLFILAEAENGWENSPGRITSASVSLVEAPR